MRISRLTALGNVWRRFHLNVGGFTIRNCRWNCSSRQILFPIRYDKDGRRHRVIFVHGAHVYRLRDLLESGEIALPRDRKPCRLRIRFLGWSRYELEEPWMIFNFTVRGFTIIGCRWQPATGSIQLPVTFHIDTQEPGIVRFRRSQVICAYGAHINRLRVVLEDALHSLYGCPEQEAPVVAA